MNKDIEILLYTAARWTVKEAIQVLALLHSETLSVTWRGFATMPVDIGAACNPLIKATNVTFVKFRSQANSREYTGSLAMFVVDRVLGDWKKRGQLKKSPPKTFKHEYVEGEQVMEYARINGAIVPILESGRQGQLKLALTSKTEPTTGSAAVELAYASELTHTRVNPFVAAP